MPNRPFSREGTWLFPPTLEELIPADHSVRYAAAFVDGLDRAAWGELGMAADGAVRGAPAYYPAVLLGVWLYGFMEGVRSSRKLEKACRDQVPSLWLTGRQRPDHHTLWRFYRDHRRAMRRLLKRTVRVAVEAGLVDLAVQAVDGTRIAGSAARERTLDAVGLTGLPARTEAAIADLEAQNAGSDEPPVARLPQRLTQLQALREQVRQAQERVAAADGPDRTYLTDSEATLQKGRNGGWLVGDNAQAMVAGLVQHGPDDPTVPSGLLITAADVTTARDDHDQLLAMIDRAEATTEVPLVQALADGGYHSAANLTGCAEQTSPVEILMPDPQAPRPSQLYHKDRFAYDATSDTYTCPLGQALTFHGHVSRGPGRPPDRKYRASKMACDACPVRAACTSAATKGRSIAISQDDATLRAHRARMATEDARTAYRRRKTSPEPAFGILKEQQGARRFLLRGLQHVQDEWSLLATAFNLRTLARVWRTHARPHLPIAARPPSSRPLPRTLTASTPADHHPTTPPSARYPRHDAAIRPSSLFRDHSNTGSSASRTLYMPFPKVRLASFPRAQPSCRCAAPPRMNMGGAAMLKRAGVGARGRPFGARRARSAAGPAPPRGTSDCGPRPGTPRAGSTQDSVCMCRGAPPGRGEITRRRREEGHAWRW